MIVVIADDLSGAAELAGLALRHGLKVEVQTAFFPGTNADVVCVDTDSRLLPPADAARRVTLTTRSIMAANPAWIFKKCDSVLRGSVLAEARAAAEASGRPRILLIPANPSRGRTIASGNYLIAGRPLHETAFAADPTHPRRTSDVRALLDGDLAQVAVPDIGCEADIQRQLDSLDVGTLPAGGADFFSALLARRVPGGSVPRPYQPVAGNALLVCGSGASWAQRAAAAAMLQRTIFTLPYDCAWVVETLRTRDSVLIGIGDGPATRDATPDQLLQSLARAIATILGQTRVDRLLLEGGATAAAVIAALGWTRLHAEQIADQGIAVLRPVAAHAPLLFVKPGSYPWPAQIWP